MLEKSGLKEVGVLNAHEMAVNREAAMVQYQIKERLKLIGPQFIKKKIPGRRIELTWLSSHM